VADAKGRYSAKLKSPKEAAKLIKQLEERMYTHARELEFEEAARLRDEIAAIKQQFTL